MLRGNQARIDFESPGVNGEVVEPVTKRHATHLVDSQASPLSAVLGRILMQRQIPVHERLRLEVTLTPAGHLLHQEHGAVALGEEGAQRQDLTAVSEYFAGEMTDIRKKGRTR